MKVCVTGGAGFIGSHLVDRLVQRGFEVVVLDDLSTGRRSNLADVADRVRVVEGDIRDRAAVGEATAGCDVVYHQAALASVSRSIEHPRLVMDVNVGGTLNVLLGARDAGARRVILASSSSVYGNTPTLPKIETMRTSPRSPYAASKASGEAYAEAFANAYDIECVCMRYFNVYGPRQRSDSPYAAVIPLFIEAMREGRSPAIHGDGGQTRDFTYVGDVVDALDRAAVAEGTPPAVCNLGAGGRTSILELFEALAGLIGFDGGAAHQPPRDGDVRDSLASIDTARAWLGWEPSTPLLEGLTATLGVSV